MPQLQWIKWTNWLIITCVIFGVGGNTERATAQEEQRTLDQFLAEKRNATMATIRANGSSQLTPVWFNWDGEQFTISITTDRAKYKNLVRDSRISLCIDDVTGYAYVTAEGKAEIRDSDIWEETGKILTKYRGKEGGAGAGGLKTKPDGTTRLGQAGQIGKASEVVQRAIGDCSLSWHEIHHLI
jgi:PPOX class probable F420-dependent enzyme